MLRCPGPPGASNIQAAVALSIVNRVPNRPSYLFDGHLCTHASRALACARVTRPFLWFSAPFGPKAEPVSAFARVLDTYTGTRNRSWSQPSAHTRRRCRCGRLAERRVPTGAARGRTHLAGPSERTESSPCFTGSGQLFITRTGPGNLGGPAAAVAASLPAVGEGEGQGPAAEVAGSSPAVGKRGVFF